MPAARSHDQLGQKTHTVLQIPELRLPHQPCPIQLPCILACEPRERLSHAGVESWLRERVQKHYAWRRRRPDWLNVCESGISESAQLCAESVVCRALATEQI